MDRMIWLKHYSIKDGRIFFLDELDTGISVPDGLEDEILKNGGISAGRFRHLIDGALFNRMVNEGIIVEKSGLSGRNETEGKRVVVLQPHCDDFALSCGAVLAKMRFEQNAQISIVNFFCKYSGEGFSFKDRIPLDDERYSGLRMEEDIAAAAYLEGKVDFLEGKYEDAYKRGKFIFYKDGFLKRDHRIFSAIEEDCRGVLEKYRPEALLIPSAIGWHVDHRIVHEAAIGAIAEYDKKLKENLKVYLYEDYPYCDGKRDIYWGRLGELSTGLKLKPVYTDITDFARHKARLINFYKSQSEMLDLNSFYAINETMRRLGSATAIEGKIQKHDIPEEAELAERMWEVTGFA